MLTRRENILQTLRHEKHDRMPAFFIIDNFNFPSQMDIPIDMVEVTGFRDIDSFVELSTYLGLDVLLRIVPDHLVLGGKTPQTRIATRSLGEGKAEMLWSSPLGDLRAITQAVPEAGANYTIEYPIKQLKDYDIFRSFLETQTIRVNEENISLSRRYLERVGNEGIAYVVVPPTPIMDLNRNWAGLEKFIYHLTDAPDLIESVLEQMSEHYCRQFELIAASTPCEVLVQWDEANSLYLSPPLFERYGIPALQKYAEIAHRHKKIFVTHSCGKIDALMHLFVQSGVDAIDWVTPSPAGDVEPKRAQEMLRERVTMILTPLASVFRFGTVQNVRDHIHLLLDGLERNQNLIFGIPAPFGTPIENIKQALAVLIDEYDLPLNSSPKFGNILGRC